MQLMVPQKFIDAQEELIKWDYWDEELDRIVLREDAPEHLKKIRQEYLAWRAKQPDWN